MGVRYSGHSVIGVVVIALLPTWLWSAKLQNGAYFF